MWYKPHSLVSKSSALDTTSTLTFLRCPLRGVQLFDMLDWKKITNLHKATIMFPLKHIWKSKLELIQHMSDKDKAAPSVDQIHFPIQSSHCWFLPVLLMEKVTLCASVRAVSHLLMFCLRRSHSLLITSHFNIRSVLFAFPTKQQASFYVKRCLTSPLVSYEKHTLTFGGLHQRPHWSKTLTLRWNSEWAPATTVTKVYALCLFLVCVCVCAISLCACVFGLLLRTVHTSTNCICSLSQQLKLGAHAIKEELQDFNWFKDTLHTTLCFLSRIYLTACKTEQWIRQ